MAGGHDETLVLDLPLGVVARWRPEDPDLLAVLALAHRRAHHAPQAW